MITQEISGYMSVWNPETEQEEQREVVCIAETEDSAEPTPEERIAELEEALELLLSGGTE